MTGFVRDSKETAEALIVRSRVLRLESNSAGEFAGGASSVSP
jgi:hypothetical protein